jgi:acyl-CoA hydrolase
MEWMEGCATISATRHCRKTCITVGVDAMQFLNPIQVGEAIIIKASVNRSFRSSCEVGVKVKSENLMVSKQYMKYFEIILI